MVVSLTKDEQLSAADALNLSEIVSYKNQYGEHVQFIALLKAYGRWGMAGIWPKALQCSSRQGACNYAVSDAMLLLIEEHVSTLRRSLVDASDLYLAFKLEYLIPQSGDEYRAVLQRYKEALRHRSKLYSVRGRQRDATAFVRRLHKAVSCEVKNLSV